MRQLLPMCWSARANVPLVAFGIATKIEKVKLHNKTKKTRTCCMASKLNRRSGKGLVLVLFKVCSKRAYYC